MIIIDMFLKKMCWKHKLRCYSTINYNNDDNDFIRVDDEVDCDYNDDYDDDNDDDCLDIIIVYINIAVVYDKYIMFVDYV